MILLPAETLGSKQNHGQSQQEAILQTAVSEGSKREHTISAVSQIRWIVSAEAKTGRLVYTMCKKYTTF